MIVNVVSPSLYWRKAPILLAVEHLPTVHSKCKARAHILNCPSHINPKHIGIRTDTAKKNCTPEAGALIARFLHRGLTASILYALTSRNSSGASGSLILAEQLRTYNNSPRLNFWSPAP